MSVAKKMLDLGKQSSVIREIFEYGLKRKAEIGAENVFDFSLGNPSVPAPPQLNDIIKQLIDSVPAEKLHGYTSAPGDQSVREAVADYIQETFRFPATAELIYMTCGAASGLAICLNALTTQDDEVIVFAPFFPEYRIYVEHSNAKLIIVPCNEHDFQPDLAGLEQAITANTKAIIVNSPNNPTGTCYREDTIQKLAEILKQKQLEFKKPIYILSDGPYRELIYDIELPYLPHYYDNTIIIYSYSKSISLAGARIGYIFVSPLAENANDLFVAICGAGRSLGYVCAPSLFQFLIKECIGMTADLSIYKKNRDILYNGLKDLGFTAVYPSGAFYLFVKSPIQDAEKFCELAKKYELLLVPSDSFGYAGFVRIAYCVSTEQIINSLPAFKQLAKEYNLLP
ncbi:MAG TPA: pyridoxal phosphate-dependent aminotransferase [Clostridiaceae bacterium]|nr:pyridoxal phosphate-dependent aminotransferase [Clostridiaceae bacterium]